MNPDVFIGLGSNLGDRESYLHRAIQSLRDTPGVELIAQAKIVETDADAHDEQPRFLNTVVHLTTILTPVELLQEIHRIEQELGRIRKQTYEPRTIDLDILFYGQDLVCTDTLTIPHPLLHQRDFVLIPMLELAPQFNHPVLHQSIEGLYNQHVWGIYNAS